MTTSTGTQSALAAEVDRLCGIEVEYTTTLSVLAIVTTRLQAATGEKQIVVTDKDLLEPPDLIAWRDTAAGSTIIKTAR